MDVTEAGLEQPSGGRRMDGINMGLKNNKSLGQHWLYNRAILDEIAQLVAKGADEGSAYDFAEKTEVCVEIGPGLGTLTASLFRQFSRIVAVEYDARLAGNLPGSFPGKNLEVVNEDILKFDFARVGEPYVVAGNIPYYITSPIIEKLLTVTQKPRRIVLLMQKEVAERILDTRESVLSLMVKNRAKVWSGPVVGKGEFTPPPKVDSMVLIMEPLPKPIVNEEVFGLIQQGFTAPRKKLIHNLAGLTTREEILAAFDEVGIDVNARPADVNLSKWQKLYEKLHKNLK